MGCVLRCEIHKSARGTPRCMKDYSPASVFRSLNDRIHEYLASAPVPRSLNDHALEYLFSRPEEISWHQEITHEPDTDVVRQKAQFPLFVEGNQGTIVEVEYEHRTQRFDCDCCPDGYNVALTIKTDVSTVVPDYDIRLRVLTKDFFHLPLRPYSRNADGGVTYYKSDFVTPRKNPAV